MPSVMEVIFVQFEYKEGVVPLRFLRLKHAHIRQNITYDCKSGVDNFMRVKLQAADGGVVSFGDKTVRMVSQVSGPSSSSACVGRAVGRIAISV